MSHATLLALLLPPESYDPNGVALATELAAEGAALDACQSSAEGLLTGGPWLFADARLLDDWERVLAITPVAGASVDERLQMVRVRLLATGGLTLDYFRRLLEAAGYTVLLDEPRGFRAGVHAPGDRLYAPEAVRFYWRIRLRRNGLPASAGEKAALAAWLDDIKPAYSHFDIED